MVPEKIESDTIKHGGAFIQASAPPPERTSVYADRRLKLDRLLSTSFRKKRNVRIHPRCR